jgi:hypothetical protein
VRVCIHLYLRTLNNLLNASVLSPSTVAAVHDWAPLSDWTPESSQKGACIASSAQLIQVGHGEIIVVMTGDPEHGAQEPIFIGEAAALYDTKAGELEAGITHTWELGDHETLFGKMCNNDVALDIIKYEPVKVGSNRYEGTANRFPV